MSPAHALLLGLLQGLTEFLPVSSSGHLALLQHFLGLRGSQVLLDVMLHLGTLGAVALVYRRTLAALLLAAARALTSRALYRSPRRLLAGSPELRLLGLLLLGSIPTAGIGLAFRAPLERAFERPALVALMLLVTGLLLQAPRLRRRPGSRQAPLAWQAVVVGVAQGVAILPGISRSGATISTALLLGVEPAAAARFSFLLSIPAILGAVVLEIGAVGAAPQPGPLALLAGTTAAFAVGYAALRALLALLARGRFASFSYYCFALGGATLAWLALG